MSSFPVNEISTLTVLLPIVVAIVKRPAENILVRAFLIFLLIGFAVDLTAWMCFSNQVYLDHIKYLLLVYSYIEGIFFIGLCMWYLHRQNYQRIGVSLFLVLSVLLAMGLGGMDQLWLGREIGPALDLTYEISASFLSGAALLKLAEQRGIILDKPLFWIFSGIFLYCFSTFFIMIFLYSDLSIHLWPLANVINIITMICYAIGLGKIKRKPVPL